MRNTIKHIAFAAFFVFVGAVLSFLVMMSIDNQKTQPKPLSHTVIDNTQAHATIDDTTDAHTALTTSDTVTKETPPTTTSTSIVKTATETPVKTIQFKTGTPLVVYDLVDQNKPATEFVPLYNANSEFDKVAVYRHQQSAQSTRYDRRMDMIYPLSSASQVFPPISEAEAQQKARQFKRNSYPEYQGKLVTFASVDIPYYYFKMRNSNAVILVDALSGTVQQITAKDMEEEKQFSNMQAQGLDKVMSVNASGQFYTAPEILKLLPKNEQKVIQAEQDFYNDMIEKGFLKVNQNGEFIEDNITQAHRDSFDAKMQALYQSILK